MTLDGFKYTFNGRGEYTLIETMEHGLTLQGRMIPASGRNESSVPATVFSAIAAKDNNSDTVQFEIGENGMLTAMVSGELVVFDITEQDFEKVTVKSLGNNSLEALFDSGVYIRAKGENNIISTFQVVLPESYYKDVHGLLGTFNGDKSDDLLPRFGDTPLSLEASTEDIHNQFGITCEFISPLPCIMFRIKDMRGRSNLTIIESALLCIEIKT